MKLLAFTDHHGSRHAEQMILARAKKEKPDLLACAGDISFFGTSVVGVLKRLNAMAHNLDVPLVLIPGNHEEGQPILSIIKKLKLGNIVYLHRHSWRYGGCFFFGWGGGGFAYRDSAFLSWASKTIKTAKKGEKTILLTHGPPYGTKLDIVVSGHCGNKDYTAFIKKSKVDLVICGHLHECFGKAQKIGKTVLLNPGPVGAVVEIR